MPLQQTFVDAINNTASLALLVGGMIETTYSYESGYFTLTDRDTDVTINRDEQRALNTAIRTWLDEIVLHCSGFGNGTIYPFKLHVEDDGSVRTYLLRLGAANTKAIKATWNRSGVTITYEKRNELVLGLEAFRRFVNVLNQIDAEMA